VDSGSSKHMTRFRNSLKNLTEKSSSLQVELGDDSKHALKGVGEASYQLDLGNSISIKDVLLVQVKIPGPISLPSWSVFDQRKALSFNCKLIYFLLFYNSQQSKSILLICYGYVLDFGCSSMSFLSPEISTCISK
jgi:hypothetical protein